MVEFSAEPRRSLALKTLGSILLVSAGLSIACDSITEPNALEAPRRASRLSAPIAVTPGAMQGWSFYNDQTGTACGDTLACRMVNGPSGQAVPLGAGSAELATSSSSDGKALILASFQGVRFADIDSLRYSTLRQTDDAGNNLAIALQFNVDYDLDDALAGYQGRIVFEPYQGASGTVLSGVWQEWDTKAGRWWGTRSTVSRNGASVPNPCVQSSPCTWPQLLTFFPSLGVHSTYGALVLKAGSGWQSFRGNVDNLVIKVAGATTIYDFELVAVAPVPAQPPDSVPALIEDPSQYVEVDPVSGISVHRSVLSLKFQDSVSQSTRSSIIASIGGRVVGGEPDPEDGDGPYYVQVADDPTGEAILGTAASLAQQPTVAAAYGLLHLPAEKSLGYRRPRDGSGWTQWEVDPGKMKFAHGGRALEVIRAPMALGV